MKLVFVNGWGFDRHFWRELASLLTQYDQKHIDLGFYGTPDLEFPANDDCVLIGHSLGFVYGMTQKHNWHSWVAINSFPRFVKKTNLPGCVTVAGLREIRINLATDRIKTLNDFYRMIGAKAPSGMPDTVRLRAGLDELRDMDIGNFVEMTSLPGLVLAARNDPLVPVETSKALAQTTGNTDMWHETGGHILPLLDAKWCADHIKNFLEKQRLASA